MKAGAAFLEKEMRKDGHEDGCREDDGLVVGQAGVLEGGRALVIKNWISKSDRLK